MEQLSPEVRDKVVKMSDDRLKQKLVQAGYRKVDLAKLDRASLLGYYAKVALTKTAYVSAKDEQDEDEDKDGGDDSEAEVEFAEGKADVQRTAGGDKSVEERRLAMEEMKIWLEEKRLEEQRLQREKQREQQQEQQRMQLEQQRMQLEEQRLQREQQLEEQRLHNEKNRESSRNWMRGN